MSLVTDSPTLLVEHLEVVRDIGYQLVAALSFLVWDVFMTLEEETEYIWPMRRCKFKWFYFYLRHFLPAVQIFHLAVFPSLSSTRMSYFLCMVWYRYVMTILPGTLCVIDIVLANRVFALFNRSRRVAIFLGILITLETGFAGSAVIGCPVSGYTEICILPHLRLEMVGGHAIIVMVVQSIILGMIGAKQFVGIRLGWGRTPLLSLLVRDATFNYLTVLLICIVCLAACGFDDIRSMAIVYWTISFYSSVGCRLVLNMERFSRERALDDEILLTSRITLYSSVGIPFQ
ncbi:hypothetical protein JVU11DRAFT_8984 [Chiua virens]|nr:hypothetical protein JVU11DRAFT_8984 [Chiua virens]